jgi:hypothetical protein
VKEKTEKATLPPQQAGKNNAFQRIQSSIATMNRGRAKGFLRQKQQEQHTKKQEKHTKKRQSK